MENNIEMHSFTVLGQEINFKPQEETDLVSPKEVVDLVNAEAEEISQALPHLESNQVAILVALKLAQQNLSNEKKTSEELNRIRSSAMDALKYIEEVSPSIN